MSEIWGLQFPAENRDSRYPFSDTATLTAATGQVLAPDLFVDASIHPLGATAGLRLTSIEVGINLLTFVVGDDAHVNLASGTIDPQTPGDGRILLRDSGDRPAGLLVADAAQLLSLTGWGVGSYAFPRTATEFVASCTIYLPTGGVRSLSDETGQAATGHVWLVGEDGVVLSMNGNELRIDITSDPYFAQKLCGPTISTTPRVLKTINFLPPTANGTFYLMRFHHSVRDSVLRVVNVGQDTVKLELATPAS